MKAAARLLLLLALLPLLAGCLDTHPLNERSIVLGLGVSPGPGKDLTYTLVLPTAVSPSPASGGPGITPSETLKSFTTQALTLSKAIDNVQDDLSRYLDLGQLTLIVLSDRLTPTQTKNVLEDLNNMNGLAQSSLLATASSVRQVITFANTLEIPPVYYPARMLTCVNCQEADYHVPFWKFYVRLHTPGASVWLPILEIQKGNLSISGIALYRDNRLAGELSEEQSGPALEGFAYGNGLVMRGTLLVPSGGHFLSLVNIAATRRISFLSAAGGVPAFLLRVRATAMVDTTSPFDPKISRLADAAIRRKVEATLTTSRRLGVDPFSLGEYLAWANPELFRRLGDWNTVYRRAKVRVQVDLNYFSPPGLRLGG